MPEHAMEETTAAVKRPARSPEPAPHAPVRAPAPAWAAAGARVPGAPSAVLAIQRAAGNQAVMRMLDARRVGMGEVIQPVIDKDEEEVPGRLRGFGAAVQREGVVAESAPANRTGLPDVLKRGVEDLSGLSLDDVRVYYNSTAPERIGALAYAQGTDIHVAPGQERHLPHEAWHVVQQKQGRVAPTLHLGGIAVNDDPGLEGEAEVMGQRAAG